MKLRIALIGVGGVGCAILPLLTRFAVTHKAYLSLIDGDQYEEKNLSRQVFPPSFVGMNKAQAQKTKLDTVMPQLEVGATPHFVTMDNALNMVRGYSHVIVGVDNHRARYVVSRAFQKELENTICDEVGQWLITAGNTEWDGNAHIYGRRLVNGVATYYGEPPEVRHEEIASDMSFSREGVSCQDLVNLEGGEQTMLANSFAAMFAFNLIQATVSYPEALEGVQDTYFDCQQHAFNVVRIREEEDGWEIELEEENNGEENEDSGISGDSPAGGPTEIEISL